MDVLLIDDSEGDARLMREVLSEINKTVRLHVVTDGLEAMAFLKHLEPYLNVPRPQLILLDLRMPKMDGLAVLGQITEHSIPVGPLSRSRWKRRALFPLTTCK